MLFQLAQKTQGSVRGLQLMGSRFPWAMQPWQSGFGDTTLSLTEAQTLPREYWASEIVSRCWSVLNRRRSVHSADHRLLNLGVF